MNVGLDVVSVGKKDKKYCPVQCWSSLTVLFGLLECKVS